MIEKKKFGDLDIALKSFSKDDLLVISVPTEFLSQDVLHELQEYVVHEKVKNKVLILPSAYSINKIHFTGIEGKKLDKISMVGVDGDIIDIKFKDSENK